MPKIFKVWGTKSGIDPSVLNSRVSQQPPPSVRNKIMRLLHRDGGPVLIGPIAVEIGYSINTTRKFLEHLVADGELSLASRKDLVELGLDPSVEAYILSTEQDLNVANANLQEPQPF